MTKLSDIEKERLLKEGFPCELCFTTSDPDDPNHHEEIATTYYKDKFLCDECYKLSKPIKKIPIYYEELSRVLIAEKINEIIEWINETQKRFNKKK